MESRIHSSVPAKRQTDNVARASLCFYCDSADLQLAASLGDLFRSVAYDVKPYQNFDSESVEDADAKRIIILGNGRIETPTSILNRFNPHVIVLKNHAVKSPYLDDKASVIEDRGDVYETFEKVANVLSVDTHSDLFLSYSRKDTRAADSLTTELLKRGYRAWVDRRDLQPSEEWRKALRHGIEASDSFVFLVTKASIASPFCLQEMDWAIEAGKRVIPVMLEMLAVEDLPAAVSSRQYIKSTEAGNSEDMLRQLVTALDRDPDMVRLHSLILRRALDWRRRREDPNVLLRGAELAEADDWLRQVNAQGEPHPTSLQITFVAASRQSQRSRQRRLWSISIAVIVITTGLAIWAGLSAIEATRQRNAAMTTQAQQDAFGAISDWERDPVKSYLEADAALKSIPSSSPLRETFEAMARNLSAHMPESVTNLEQGVSWAAFSPDLSRVAIKRSTNPLRIAPLTGYTGPDLRLADDELAEYFQLKFSSDGIFLASLLRPIGGNAESFAIDVSGLKARKQAGPLNIMPAKAHLVLVIWNSITGKRVSSIPLDFIGNGRAEIIGFTPDDKFVLVQSSDSGTQYQAHVLRVDHPGEIRPPWTSSLKFLLGQVAANAIVQVGYDNKVSVVQVLDPVTGAQLWPSIRVAGTVRQVHLAHDGKALAIVTQPGARTASTVSVFVLSGASIRSIGQPWTVPGSIFVWDMTRSASKLLVMNSSADIPAEMWDTNSGNRVTIPVSKQISTPFVMKTGEEVGPLSFVDNEKFILVREPIGNPLEGAASQQFLLFDSSTLVLAAAPFPLSLSYLSMVFDSASTRFAIMSHDGLEEEFDLLRQKLPQPEQLPLGGLVLNAVFLPDGQTLLTQSREGNGPYFSRFDLWAVHERKHLGQLPDRFGVLAKFCLDSENSILATASPSADGETYEVKLWDLTKQKNLWTRQSSAPVDSIAFRGKESELSTAGTDKRGDVIVANYHSRTGNPLGTTKVDIEPGSIHLAFSPDGENLVADYNYDSAVVWNFNHKQSIRFHFSDAAGLPFELGYDILLDLRNVQLQAGRLQGELSGHVPVVVRPEGNGTTILPSQGQVPVLSAYTPTRSSLSPVRGNNLVSDSGQWFALATNVTPVANASGLRIYDFVAGYPTTDLLIHQTMARPGEVWPKIQSARDTEFDPVLAIAYRDQDGVVLTLTTNGVLRTWPFRRNQQQEPWWSTPSTLSDALTCRRLINGSYVRRIPEKDFVAIRQQLGTLIDEIRK